MSKDETYIKTTVRIPERLWVRFRQLAIAERTSAQDLVISAIELYLKTAKGGKA